jgi:putative two-component system response regulator
MFLENPIRIRRPFNLFQNTTLGYNSAGYRAIVGTTDPTETFDLYDSVRPGLLILDLNMPQMSGFEVMKILAEKFEDDYHPILVLTAQRERDTLLRALRAGARDFLTKPFDRGEIVTRIRNMIETRLLHLKIKKQNQDLDMKVKERTKELIATQDATIYSMAVLAEYRDPETGGHIRRTQGYVRCLAEVMIEMGCFAEELVPGDVELLYKSAPLHDIGKVGVADSILLKHGKLTEKEFEEMKRHARYGASAIRAAEEKLGNGSSFLMVAREIAAGHHEKWDGSGYPGRLRGEQIPLSARLMAIADVYDALISKRVYKPPFSHGKAVSIIVQGRAKHFDPLMVDVFAKIDAKFRSIALEHCDRDEERIALMHD